jgi:hypothetical protein
MKSRVYKHLKLSVLFLSVLIVMESFPAFIHAQGLYSRSSSSNSSGTFSKSSEALLQEKATESASLYSRQKAPTEESEEDYSGLPCPLCGSTLLSDGSCSNPSCDRNGDALAGGRAIPIEDGLWILVLCCLAYATKKKVSLKS